MRSLPIVLLAAVLFAACPAPDDTTDGGQPVNTCVGGIITDAGECVAKCDPSKCKANNTCVDNKCQLECTAHSQCKKYVQQCLPAKEDDTGRDIFVCTDTPPMEYGDPCPNGDECGTTCANWDGPADTDAYCSQYCAQDADCPGGFECQYQRDPHALCEDGGVGNQPFCGETDEACVSAATVETPDSGFAFKAYCLQRGLCIKKSTCSPCESDVDCSYDPELSCRQLNKNERVCLPRCAQDTDCFAGGSCIDGFCSPLGATCKGDGEFCSTCKSDLDCTPPHACVTLHGTERSCVDVTYSITCTKDADCPEAPSGVHGNCVDLNYPNTPSILRCGPPNDGDITSCY